MTEELEPLNKRIPNTKWRRFIDKYFELNMNATKAYQEVYGTNYESARRLGSQLLSNVDISGEIERRLKELAMPVDEAIARLGNIARGDIGDFVTIKDSKDLEEHKQSSIVKKFKKKIYYNKDGEPDYDEIELEAYPADAALRDILKMHGKFIDRIEHTGKDGKPIEFKEVVVELNEPVDD